MEGNLGSSQYYHQVRFYTVPNCFYKSKEEQYTNKSLLWILIVLQKQTGLCWEIENNDMKIMKFRHKYVDDLGVDCQRFIGFAFVSFSDMTCLE